jgi:hypothetical protein
MGDEAKKKSKMTDSKKLIFSKSPIFKIVCENLMDWPSMSKSAQKG